MNKELENNENGLLGSSNSQFSNLNSQQPVDYTDDNIRHLDDMDHIRMRSGMYIGRLGDGSQADDGIYVLLKETVDNSIDDSSRQDGGCREQT